MANSWNPAELLAMSSAYWRGCTLQAAVRLNIFTVIGRTSKSLGEISGAIGCDTRATEFLLNALAALGLLEKDGGSYMNGAGVENLLSRDSSDYLGHILLHHHHLVDGWAQLDVAVRTGKPVQTRSYGEEVERELDLDGVFFLMSGGVQLQMGNFRAKPLGQFGIR